MFSETYADIFQIVYLEILSLLLYKHIFESSKDAKFVTIFEINRCG